MYCQRQRCSPRSVVSGDIRICQYASGFAGKVVSNASFLPRSLYLPFEVSNWLYIGYRIRHESLPVYWVKHWTVRWNSSKIISRMISLTFLLSADLNVMNLLQREHLKF